MPRYLSLLFLAVIALLRGFPAHAVEFAAGPTVSTLGFGVEVPIKLTDRWSVRVEANRFRTGARSRIGAMRWDFGLRLGTLGAAVDFRPNRDGLVLSLGYYLNRNQATMQAKPSNDVQIGSRTFTPAEVGTLRGEMDYGRFAPYFGLGYDNTFRNTGSWSFAFRAGFLYMGQSQVSLSATGTLKNNLAFLKDLAEEQEAIEGVLDVLRFYPVMALAVRYRF